MIKLFNLNCKQNKTNVRLARSMKPFDFFLTNLLLMIVYFTLKIKQIEKLINYDLSLF